MAVKIIEKFDSREATEGVEQPSADLLYVVTGTENELTVRATVEGTVPAFYLGLPFQEYHIKHQGNGIWDASARYSKHDPKESTFSFDTGGGTQHITQSIKTVAKHGLPAKPAPDFKGAIGVTTDSVEGVDITVPVYNFTETHYIPASLVTPAYKALLFSLTGKVNSQPFKGFAELEVLFLGASGSKRGKDDWEITFRFAASPNVTNLKVGDITGISKYGWDYLWVRYADAEDEHVLVKQPIAVYCEQVYEVADLNALGI
jgi:hypothetical protein